MRPIWLIERGVYKDYETQLVAEVQRQGMACHLVNYHPGKSPPDDITGYDDLGTDVIFIGSHPLMRQIQLHRNWKPGGWCNFHSLQCSTYYEQFKHFLLNSSYQIITGQDAHQRHNELYDQLGVDDELFVRPNGVEKTFPGAVIHIDNFQQAISSTRFDPAARIVVASPREIEREWRIVVAGDSGIAFSQYRNAGAIELKPGCPTHIREFCDFALSETQWRPDQMFMMDICESNGALYVLELNGFSCSGLYRCELATVVGAATEMACRICESDKAR